MMMLGVMWMMTAAVVGFMLGRVSMYGQTGVLEAVEDMEEGYSVEKKHSMGERDFKEERHSMEEAKRHRGNTLESGVAACLKKKCLRYRWKSFRDCRITW